jgi:hypothetical protein
MGGAIVRYRGVAILRNDDCDGFGAFSYKANSRLVPRATSAFNGDPNPLLCFRLRYGRSRLHADFRAEAKHAELTRKNDRAVNHGEPCNGPCHPPTTRRPRTRHVADHRAAWCKESAKLRGCSTWRAAREPDSTPMVRGRKCRDAVSVMRGAPLSRPRAQARA